MKYTKHLLVTAIITVASLACFSLLAAPRADALIAGVNSGTPCVGSTAPAAGQWKHVVVLMFENQTYSNVVGSASAPYITSLVNKCGTAYSGTTGGTPKNNWHDANYKVNGTSDGAYNSKPSYGVLTNGRPASETGIVDDTYSTTTTVDNIYNVLRLAGKDAKNYYSGPASATPCAASNFSGAYHDTLRYYTNLGGQSADPTTYCNTHDKPITQFMTDVNGGKLPAYSMILPTNCENMHSCSSVSNVVSNADTWAKGFLTPFLDSDQYKSGDTAIFFIWDEDTAVPNVLMAPSVIPGSKVPAPTGNPISHYSALKTASEMLGVGYVGYSAQAPSLLSFFSGGGVQAPAPVDTTIPSVAITAPTTGSTVSSASVTVNATASDNVGVAKVVFAVNGVTKATATTSPYTFNWTTAGLTSGSYTITATAFDAANNSAASSVAVNFVAPTTCPAVPTTLGTGTMTVTVPAAGTYHVWSKMWATSTTNNSYYLQVDGSCPILIGDSASQIVGNWSWVDYRDGATTTKADVNLTAGSHVITMIGRESGVRLDRVMFLSDACAPTGLGDNCTVAPDLTAPTVAVSSPASGTTLSGITNLAATATDEAGGTGVARVEFYYNGTLIIASDPSAPYQASWDTTKIPNGVYALTAKAFDVAGNSAISTSVSVTVNNADTTAPSVPANLRTSGIQTNQTVLAWDASTDAGGSGLAGYHLYRNGVLISTTTTTTVTDTTVNPNTSYLYTVDAYDNAGNKSTTAGLNVTTPAVADTTPPSTPLNLQATLGTSNNVSLTWTASTDVGGSGVAGYYIRRNGVVISNLTAATSYQDATVISNTTYVYEVVAADAAGNKSTASAPANVTTPVVADTTPPTVPLAVTGLAISSDQVNITWGESNDTGGSGLVGYNVYRDNVKINGTAPVISTNYGDATVVAGRSYQYAVSSVDGAGNESAKSTSVSITTPSGDSSVLLSDNFEAGNTAWTPVLGTWANSTDPLHGGIYHQSAMGDAWSTFGDSTWKDYSVQAYVQPQEFNPPAGGTAFAAVYGRWQDDTHWYYVVLRSNGQLELKRNEANTYTVLASKAMTITKGTWYKVRLEMAGTSLKVFVNDQQQLTATDSIITSGKAAVGTYYTAANFDDVIVTKATQPQTLSLVASEDAEIRQGSASTNYGNNSTFSVDDSPSSNVLIKFNVAGINGRTVTSAKLRLYATNGSTKGGSFHATSNAWKETTVNWSNAPAGAKTALDTLGAVSKGSYYEVDVSNYVRADGTYSIRAKTSSVDGADYASSENGTTKHKPTLVLTVQ